MATLSQPLGLSGRSRSQVGAFPADSLRFDTAYAALTLFFSVGLFLDGWAHNHGKVDNSFFTPWHAVLYGSVLLIGLLLAITFARNVLQGYAPMRALPRGYTLSLFGVMLFFVGGGFDLIWHTLFGFEANLETLLSPAHLLLASSAFLFVSGPLRAVWFRADRKSWSELFPAIVSLTVLLSLMTFFTQYVNMFGNPWMIAGTTRPSDFGFLDTISAISVLTNMAIISGVFLFSLRRWTLPFGAFAFMLTLNYALMCWMRWTDAPYMIPLVVAGAILGFAIDLLYVRLKPSVTNLGGLRFFNLVMPMLLSLGYFLLIIATTGTWWKVHMWLGTTVIAGIVGLLLSYLMVPPAIPVDQA
jgi:hypothetical protein